ncbi:hypothetical protein CC1G_06451 [Coprinopsis cinerea okayama7|uniref:Uncharacterized protein n=1 Tax=Coprinopsis cinerea (strain Okayama-7 / 130 / ATCC MYA-4618 / FGSC 9003) TaxID=240176 RepID=A8NN52_COPC7|nr:hypothetical protein CC1G_06451 [Coprinopsis cinerea okayama7\|eukprot:XP_001835048.2 hypothetical protein CC1G_06451 [Coprinopsis cinerea okayama7\
MDTMLMLPQADREQCAAFIRDERVLIVWSESIDRIVPLCQDFEERLIKLLWRSRPMLSGSAPSTQTHISIGSGVGSLASGGGMTPLIGAVPISPSALSGVGAADAAAANEWGLNRPRNSSLSNIAAAGGVDGTTGSRAGSLFRVHGGVVKGIFGELGRDPEEYDSVPLEKEKALTGTSPGVEVKEKEVGRRLPRIPRKETTKKVQKRTWYGRKYTVEVPLSEKEMYELSPQVSDSASLAEQGSLHSRSTDTSPTIGPDGAYIHPPTKGDKKARWGIGGRSRPVKLYSPIYNGIAAGMALVFVGNGIRTLLMEWRLDGDYSRFALVFFATQIVQNLAMAVGPIAHFHENSKYYSAVKPKPNKEVDNCLPHVTIQMPVYKESLDSVLAPSIQSLKKAMQTYARQGGTSNIFINDDGLRLLSPGDRDARLAFYANHNIGWVARPKHDDGPDGFKRAGRFKKASNMNYGLALSLKMEKHLEALVAQRAQANSRDSTMMTRTSDIHGSSNGEGTTQFGAQYQGRDGDESVRWGVAFGNNPPAGGTPPVSPISPFNGNGNGRSTPNGRSGTPRLGGGGNGTGTPVSNGGNPLATWGHDDLEEKALALAIEEMWEESGRRWRPWAANGKNTRIGEIVLIVDSDTVVPEDCLRDAAREMRESPTVAIIQHESDVLQVAHHYFENGIAYFTRRINKCISISCANGEVAPFMGHNAFLRWKAIQDAAFVDPADGQVKIWSEANVSEDFDMALRLMLKGYIIRWATYSDGGFKEGVSLSVDDELNRWQKYAYGCNELLFNPIIEWWRKGPVSRQIHKFLWSSTPLHYKISMLAYGIAGAITISLINYVLLGFQFPVDGFFMHSFEIWLATTVVFWGSGTVGYTLLEYRLGRKSLALVPRREELLYARGSGQYRYEKMTEMRLWGVDRRVGGVWEGRESLTANNGRVLSLCGSLGLYGLSTTVLGFFFFGGLAIPLTQAILAHLFSYNMQWAATKKEVERSNFFKEIPKIAKRFWFSLLFSFIILVAIVILATPIVPLEWRITGEGWAVILPLAMTAGCHILFPIVLNPWLMVFSY